MFKAHFALLAWGADSGLEELTPVSIFAALPSD